LAKVSGFVLGWFASHKLNITKHDVPDNLHCCANIHNFKNMAADLKTRPGESHSSCGLGTPDLVDSLRSDLLGPW